MSEVVIVVPLSINDTGAISPHFVVAAGVKETTYPWGFFRYRLDENDWQIMTIRNNEPVFCRERPILELVSMLPSVPNCILLVSREDYPVVRQFLIQAGHTITLYEYNGSLSTSGW